MPLLGVCLGHQGLCSAYGGKVVHAPEAMHGRLSAVTHEDSRLFAGLPREFQVVRYHSLCVEQPLPDELEADRLDQRRDPDGASPTATGRSGACSSTPSRSRTEHGRALLARFRDLTIEHSGRRGAAARCGLDEPVAAGAERRRRPSSSCGSSGSTRPTTPSAPSPTSTATATRPSGSTAAMLDGRARFSFMGDASGPLGSTDQLRRRQRRADGRSAAARSGSLEESIFDYLSREMRRLRYLSDDLPFDFNCGFAGYFGYELKADVEGDDAHASTMPDACVRLRRPDDRLRSPRGRHLRARRLPAPDDARTTDRWIAETCLRLASLPPIAEPEWSEVATEREPVGFKLARSHQQYLDDIAECKRQLIDGESYEICLTNKITADVGPDPLRALPDPAPGQPGALLGLPEVRRGGGAELLAGALPLDRPRSLGGGEADQGHGPARQRAGRGRAPRRGAAHRREDAAPRT